MDKLDILYNKIKNYYINNNDNIDINNQNKTKEYVKNYIQKSLDYQVEHLYDDFYKKKFVYQIKEIDKQNRYILVNLLKDYKFNEPLKTNMFIVNDY